MKYRRQRVTNCLVGFHYNFENSKGQRPEELSPTASYFLQLHLNLPYNGVAICKTLCWSCGTIQSPIPIKKFIWVGGKITSALYKILLPLLWLGTLKKMEGITVYSASLVFYFVIINTQLFCQEAVLDDPCVIVI